ncbi:hypothetical protein Sjap_016357 [Stephania japonica]|uniref:Uncharacterized protein n=1 Tax=Stephania japonica TaxID=461633 RepID=A0AAP0ILF2_9MAGN
MRILILIVSAIGLISLLNSLLPLLTFLYKTFIRPPKNLSLTYGSWALITAPTDGIGRAFAFQLARRGLNLVLLGRNPEKLQHVSNAILTELPNTKIKTVQVDFSNVTKYCDIQGVIERAIEGLDVGVLINNVGVTYPSAKFFHEVEEQVLMDLIRVNVEGTSVVTRAVLPGMVERRRGAIVNIGSGAGLVAPSHPLFAIYAATKSYIRELSRSVYVECKYGGIHVQYQVPLYVATNMAARVASVEKPSLFTPSPDDYARAAIRCIGYESISSPYWAHALQWHFANFVPESLLDEWRLSLGMSRMASNPNRNEVINPTDSI